jgi:HK97 family phage prohead protease
MTATLSFGLEIKSLSDREFEGHGSIFGNVDLGGDVVLPGAFKRTLADHKKAGSMPSMFWMHKPDQVAGAWSDVREDSKGLYVRGSLADTQLGNEMRELLRMKAVRGLSIGYRTNESDYDREGNRLLKEVDLWEISIVSMAMNPLAKVEASKSRLSLKGEYVPTEREFERTLRDAGYSRAVARHLAGKVFDAEVDSGTLRHSRQWDAGPVENDEERQAAELLKSLNRFTDKVGAAALSR